MYPWEKDPGELKEAAHLSALDAGHPADPRGGSPSGTIVLATFRQSELQQRRLHAAGQAALPSRPALLRNFRLLCWSRLSTHAAPISVLALVLPFSITLDVLFSYLPFYCHETTFKKHLPKLKGFATL